MCVQVDLQKIPPPGGLRCVDVGLVRLEWNFFFSFVSTFRRSEDKFPCFDVPSWDGGKDFVLEVTCRCTWK